MTIYYAALMERAITDRAAIALMQVAAVAGKRGYTQLAMPYNRTDLARNHYVRHFLSLAQSDDDVLVMLDCDHAHPMDVVPRLVAHNVDVAGALAFKRGNPPEPCFFIRSETEYITPAYYPQGLVPCAVVGTGAIAIKRRVFKMLESAGFQVPFFRYEYTEGNLNALPSEDMYFGKLCQAASVQVYVDTTLVTPHLAMREVAQADWTAFLEANKDALQFVDNTGTPLDDVQTKIREAAQATIEPPKPQPAPVVVPARIMTRMDV